MLLSEDVELILFGMDVFELISGYPYVGTFLLLFVINVVPVLMPPSWVVLGSFYAFNPGLNLLLLSAVGATGSLAGRIVLMRMSVYLRRFMGKRRTSALDDLTRHLSRRRYGFFLASVVWALSPLPSNALFIAYGIMKAKRYLEMFSGFWIGRLFTYYVMAVAVRVVFEPFSSIFDSGLEAAVVTDVLSLVALSLFACVDWRSLIDRRKLRFVRPSFLRF